ncbi:MAG: gamma carbonic anhydrase family protein [Pseudomonadota bacterium]
MKELYQDIYQHESALKFGDVRIGIGSSMWPYSVIRAEFNSVIIGKFSNIQDFVMLHVGDKYNTEVGDYCSIAHRAVLHGCKIGNNCLVGVGAIVMDGCIVGDNVIIGAGAYLPPNTVVPDNAIVVGNPAQVERTRNNFVANRMNAVYYNLNAKHYQVNEFRAWSDPDVKRLIKQIFVQVSKEKKLLYP